MIAPNTLEVGITPAGDEIVINHPDLQPDAKGVGHIIFSPEQARHLAHLLEDKADEIQRIIPPNSTDPRQMREDSLMWARAGYPAVAIGRYRDASYRIEQLTEERDYARKLHEELCADFHNHMPELFRRKTAAELDGDKSLYDQVHSDSFVVMFTGFATARLHREGVNYGMHSMLEAWKDFKAEMGKK